MTQTILTGIAIGIFPLPVLAAVFNKLTLSVLKGYVFALMWLQSWPMLYAILNSAMTFYAKQNGAPVVLSEISQIQLKYSDLASTAGYLSMMIPPLSRMMVRGLGAGFSSVYSHFASSAISPTASAAGSVVDGNYSYGNMQTENVNGFSWSTNSTTSFGQMMYQTGSGATATQTRDGNMVMDASGAMSRLPVGINTTRQIAAAQQEMAREASNRAESALHGFSSSIASARNTLSQFGSNRGSSDSVTGGADSTMSAQDSMMASRMRSAVESYAKAHNISNEQATRELASRSTTASAGLYGDAHAGLDAKPSLLVCVLMLALRLVGEPVLTVVIWTHMKPVVAAGLPMMLAMILTLEPVRTLKRPAITLPVAKSVNPAAILTIMPIPVWTSCLQP